MERPGPSATQSVETMPEEILAITIVAIVFGSIVTIVKSVLGYRERTRFGVTPRAGSRSHSSGGASLTTSELEDMMRRAVADATAPLAERMDVLESHVASARRLPEADLLQDPLESPEQAPVRKTIGTRAG